MSLLTSLCRLLPRGVGPWICSIWLRKGDGRSVHRLALESSDGRYFDALHLTGYYYTFIGIGQLMAALLLLIPRTTLLGAMVCFPIIVNICVLTYALRFEGTRIAPLMLLANLFLLAWDYDRLKHVLSPRRVDEDPHVLDKISKFPILAFRVRVRGGRFRNRYQRASVRHPTR